MTGDEAVITAGRFTTSLRLKPAEDYPRLAPNDGQGVRVDAAAFAAALRQVVRAASKDDLRPILTGVLLTAHAGGLRLVATDSYRLAVRDLKGVSMLEEGQRVLVAAKGLAEVQRLAGDGEIEVVLRDRDVVFRTSRAEVTARLIEGDFPNYEQLIPSGYPNRLTVSRGSTDRGARPRADRRPEPRQRGGSPRDERRRAWSCRCRRKTSGTRRSRSTRSSKARELTVAFNPVFLRDGVDAVDAERGRARDDRSVEAGDVARRRRR